MSENQNEVMPESESALAMLTDLYAGAPVPVQYYLDNCLRKILAVDVPKLSLLLRAGPAVDTDKLSTVSGIFTTVVDSEPEEGDRVLSEAVSACGLRIAELVDECALAEIGDDTQANRSAGIDLVTHHANLVRSLSEIALTGSQRELLERADAEPDSAA